jgi:glycosyltransferase involved in cell wall biosynthesis
VTPRLSILIPTIPSRADLLSRLLKCLEPQLAAANGAVEVISDCEPSENRGGRPTGCRRNDLVAKVQHDGWVASIDDDDLVADDYCSRILAALERDPDCVGIVGVMTTDNTHSMRFIQRRIYDKWFMHNGVYHKSPTHLNPIRAEIVRRCPFPCISFGEDREFSRKVVPLLKTEVHIPKSLYRYLYVNKKVV